MSLSYRRRNSRSDEARRCPECLRGLALKWSFHTPKVRYCRWAEEGKCAYSEDAARIERNRILERLNEESDE